MSLTGQQPVVSLHFWWCHPGELFPFLESFFVEVMVRCQYVDGEYPDKIGRYDYLLLKGHQLALLLMPHASSSAAAIHWMDCVTFGSGFGKKDHVGAS